MPPGEEMNKLIIVLGKKIHHNREALNTKYDLYNWLLWYPELTVAGHAMHADDYVRQNLNAYKERLKWMDAHWDETGVVVFTQSEPLVMCLGAMVQEKQFDSKVVEIHLYDNECKTHTVSTFSDDGVLQNWPIGWFLLEM